MRWRRARLASSQSRRSPSSSRSRRLSSSSRSRRLPSSWRACGFALAATVCGALSGWSAGPVNTTTGGSVSTGGPSTNLPSDGFRLDSMKACAEPLVAVRRVAPSLLFVVFLRRRLAAVTAAHLLAQVRRLRVDRRQRVDGAERGGEPGQRAAVEAALEELRRLLRAHRRRNRRRARPRSGGGRCGWRRRPVVAGGADEAGLHAVGAGIAVEQRIVVVHDAVAVADRVDVPIEIVFREFADQRARQDAEIARRGDVIFRRQPVRVDEIGSASCRAGAHWRSSCRRSPRSSRRRLRRSPPRHRLPI